MTMLSAKDIAAKLNATEQTYFGQPAKGWEGPTESRIYFGRDYVTITNSGEVHNRKAGKARANTIGESAVELVKAAMEG